MSGIFRHSAPASNNNNSSETTPRKRISFGAFCTSPGTLQDVTMDNTYGAGYRSPCVSMQQYHHGALSPAVQGRSVREFEEHTAALRKENFNLKLRLYFIEENIPALKSNGGDGCDTAMRELIDHKVEVEMLRRELEEKKAVLKDALQAIEDLENIQKETETNYEAKIDDLKQKIQILELDRHADRTENNELLNTMLGRSEIIAEHVNTLQKIRELEAAVKTGEESISELENKVTFLDGILVKRDQTVQDFEEKLKTLEYQNSELHEELNEKKKELASSELCAHELLAASEDLRENLKKLKGNPSSDYNFEDYLENCLQNARNQNESIHNLQILRQEVRQQRVELADKICIIEELKDNMLKMKHKQEKALQTIQTLMQTMKLQQNEIRKLKSEDEVTKKPPSTGSSGFNTDCTNQNRSLSDTDAPTAAATSLDHFNKRDLEATIELQQSTIKNLQTEVKQKTADLQNIVNKELWERNREIERLTKLNHSGTAAAVAATTTTNQTIGSNGSFADLQQQSSSALDTSQIIQRNNLLQRKNDILVQRLNVARENEAQTTKLRQELRETRAEAERAEHFRRDCANLCTTLTERLEELAGFLNTLLQHKDVLGFLAADRRRAMRKAVDRSLDLSKSLNRTLSITGIGLSEHGLSQLCNLSVTLGDISAPSLLLADTTRATDVGALKTFNSHEHTQAIETLRAENKALKKELDKRRTAEAKKDRRSLPAVAAATIAALENHSESEAWSEPDRKVSLARIGLEDHSASLLVSKDLTAQKSSHIDTDTESDAGVDALNHSRSGKLRSQQQQQETIVQLEQLIAQRDDRILQIQCQLVEADNRLKQENLRVLDLKHEVEDLRLRNEQLHNDFIAVGSLTQREDSSLARDESMWLRQIEEQTQLLECIKKERDQLSTDAASAGQQIISLKATIEKLRYQHESELREASEQEFTKLEQQRRSMEAVVQQQLEEQQELQSETLQQLTELQRQYVEAQRSIDSQIENAKELRQALVESELNARALKKQLDESTLQATQAVLERTKAMNEKLKLEQAMETYKAELSAAQNERDAFKKRIEDLELEAKQKVTKDTFTQLNGSDISQSGYTSEEVAPLTRTGVGVSTGTGGSGNANDKNGRQRQNNSSPDLGIESDAGRVSSVELSNIHRSLLMKIEVPTTDGVVKTEDEKKFIGQTDCDAENRPPNAGVIVHDCAKVEQENADLRRKLIRTKRHLEETYQVLCKQNQMKAQLEKDIKSQIMKTHNVLKNARSNMESEKK